MLLLLFCATLNVINRFYYFIFIAVAFFAIKPNRKINLDICAILSLFLLAVNWLIFSPETASGSILSTIKPFTYLLCYLLGMSLFNDDSLHSNKKISYSLFYIVVVVIALGSLTHYVLNWITNASTDISRNTVDFWSGQPMAATGQASLACLPLALAIACIFSQVSKKLKILSWLTIIIIIGYNLILSGRTLFIMLISLIVLAFIHKLKEQGKGKLKAILIFVLIIMLFFFAYQNNLFGIKSYFESTPIYDRFFAENSDMELSEDGRMDNKIFYLQNMFSYPFGGGNLHEQTGYAHDIFLDTYDEAGIFALLAIITFMILSLTHLIKCIKNKELPFLFRQIVFCVYILIYIEFMVEPILQGMPWLFAAFCIIDGYVNRILKENEKLS